MLPHIGTLAQFLQKRDYRTRLGEVTIIPKGVYKQVDELETIMDIGTKLNVRTRFILFIPTCVLLFALPAFVALAAYIIGNHEAGDSVQNTLFRYGWFGQIILLWTSLIALMFPIALQPSDINGITIIAFVLSYMDMKILPPRTI